MKEIEALRRLPDRRGAVPDVDVVAGTLLTIREQARGRHGGGVDPVFTSCSVVCCAVAVIAVPLGVSAWTAYTDPLASILMPFTMVMQ